MGSDHMILKKVMNEFSVVTWLWKEAIKILVTWSGKTVMKKGFIDHLIMKRGDENLSDRVARKWGEEKILLMMWLGKWEMKKVLTTR
jgi:hypothetical protein